FAKSPNLPIFQSLALTGYRGRAIFSGCASCCPAYFAGGKSVMSILDPEILQELSGLSVGLCVSGAVIGLLLWLTGWWLHRFWIVLATTALAGILGLVSGSVHGVQALIAAVLLAVAAGILALALIRLVAFAAGGAAACFVLQKLS